ncbi:hypothetical protein [Streptomyces sp. NPDC048710]|uniref:hypothetical protein n=1 Tax=Streptomyces sp. NPDC048710 TaxID=3365586 RepID=UPI00371E426C
MTGRHRLPEPDGVAAGASLLGAVIVGLGLVASIVTSEARTAPAPAAYSVPDAEPPATVLTAVHLNTQRTCRRGPRATP